MRVALVGLGLIGGSLGLALRVAGLATHVTGSDRDPANLTLALERGAIDTAAVSAAEAVRGADLVVVATPVLAVREVFRDIAPALAPGCIVTDVSSTKAAVMAWAAELLPRGVHVIGGHPMAGSEKAGMAAARLNLLRGAVYCLTPSPTADGAAIAALEGLVRGIGARPLRLDADAHDEAVAAISHVPFLTSTALVRLTTHDPAWPLHAELAATGFRDATRLASGDPAMYRDICLTNGSHIGPLLRKLAGVLNEVADELDDRAALEDLFTDARARREEWLAGSGGFRLP